MIIREELPSEYKETEELVREAFWNVYSPGCSEHYLLHIMRQDPDFVKSLDLVAVENDKLVGHVANMRSVIKGDDGMRHEVLTLGPIAVLPDFQGMGVGKRLIAEVRQRARVMGFDAIVLCGNPDYYNKVGFEPAEKYAIRNSDNMIVDALQVCGLSPDALKCLAGRYIENDIYQVAPKDVEEFDKRFPRKVKLTGTPSQKLFAEIAGRCRPYSRT